MRLTMKPSNFEEQLRRAKRSAKPRAHLSAHEEANEAEVIVNSKLMSIFCFQIAGVLLQTTHSRQLGDVTTFGEPANLFLPTSRRKEDTKRQRTGSDSSSPPSDSKTLLPNVDTDEEADRSTKAVSGSHKKMRGAAARNHRDKEIREREEKRERERADAAGRRKGRAERRRGDGPASDFLLSCSMCTD